MARLSTFVIIALIGITTSHAQSFEKSIQGTNAQFGTAMQATSDGGFILAGYTMSYGISAGFYDNLYLVRTDANGDTLWTRVFGGAGTDRGFAVQQTSDDGFLVVGSSDSFGSAGADVYLVRTDADGDLLWSKTYGGPGEEIGYGLAITPDGGAIIVGQSGISGGAGGGLNTYVIRTDANGDTLWTRTYDSGSDNLAYSVSEAPDGGHIIAGVGAFGLWYMEVLRIDDNGDVVWNRAMSTGYAQARSAIATLDGAYMVVGQFGDDAAMVKLDANGDTLWAKTFGGAQLDYGYSVKQTDDGGYVFSGENFSRTWMVRTDTQGNETWQHTYSTGNAEVNQVVLNSDGGFSVCANRFGGPGSGGYAMQLLRTQADGLINCNMEDPLINVLSASPTVSIPSLTIASYGNVGTPSTLVSAGAIMVTPCSSVDVKEATTDQPFSVFPNPASDQLTLRTDVTFTHMELVDAMGRTWPIAAVDASGRTLDVSRFAAGPYLLRGVCGDHTSTSLPFIKD